MPENDCVVQQSGCCICLEDNDVDKLDPPVTSEERRLFGGVDGECICMYSLLHSRFVAGTYAREVVPLHDVVPGPRVPRCWLHKDSYDEWLPYMNFGHQTGLCPGCNRGALLDYQNKIVVFDKENMDARFPCGPGRTLTPLYVAVEANCEAVVTHLLQRTQPLQIDATSEVDGRERTPMRCAAERGYWLLVEELMDAGAKIDLWTTRALEAHLSSDDFARVRQPDIVDEFMKYNHNQRYAEAGILQLAARAGAWDTVHQIVSRVDLGFGDLNKWHSVVQSDHGCSVLVMAARHDQWHIVKTMLYTWQGLKPLPGQLEQLIASRDGAGQGDQDGGPGGEGGVDGGLLPLPNSHIPNGVPAAGYERQLAVEDVVPRELTLSEQKKLAKATASLLLAADGDGMSALDYADLSWSSDALWNAVSVLIDCNAYVDPRQCYATQQLLHSAAQASRWKVVKHMLRFRNIVQCMQMRTTEQDRTNERLLWLACENDGWQIVCRLVGVVGVHPAIPNADGQSPLCLAAHQHAWDEMRVMLTFVKKADMQLANDLRTPHVHDIHAARLRLGPVFAKDANGDSLVTLAASVCKWDIVWRLLNEFHVDPATTDASGRSLLEIVITKQEWPMAAYLFDETWRDMPVDTDMSCLATYAAAHHQWSLVNAIMKHGPLVSTATANLLVPVSIDVGVWAVVFWGLHRGVVKASDWMVREALEHEKYWILEFLYRHGARRPMLTVEHPTVVQLDTELPDEDIRIALQGMGLADDH
jgi:hypothetical protein